jgi:hypothetical protein
MRIEIANGDSFFAISAGAGFKPARMSTTFRARRAAPCSLRHSRYLVVATHASPSLKGKS